MLSMLLIIFQGFTRSFLKLPWQFSLWMKEKVRSRTRISLLKAIITTNKLYFDFQYFTPHVSFCKMSFEAILCIDSLDIKITRVLGTCDDLSSFYSNNGLPHLAHSSLVETCKHLYYEIFFLFTIKLGFQNKNCYCQMAIWQFG